MKRKREEDILLENFNITNNDNTYKRNNEYYKFFESLYYYEKLRFIYSFKGLQKINFIPIEIIRNIIIDFMYVSCKYTQCNRIIKPFTERYYDSENPNLFQEIKEEFKRVQYERIKYNRDKLLSNGVPYNRLFIIHANDNPIDGGGVIYEYTEDFFDKTDMYEDHITIPFHIYDCVDICDTESIRFYLNERTLSNEELKEIQSKCDSRYCIIQ